MQHPFPDTFSGKVNSLALLGEFMTVIYTYFCMETQTRTTQLSPIIPVNDEVRSMLDYASSASGHAKIEIGRQEIRGGKGIPITPRYFENLSRRISERVTRNRAA